MSETVNKSRLYAELTLMVSLLNAFRLLEIPLIGASLIGIVSIGFSHSEMTRLLAFGVFLVGLAGLYIGFRIRIDARLFDRWESIDPVELDRVLQKMNPRFEPGRTLEARLAGAHSFFMAGVGLTILQYGLLALMAWIYVP